jgi:hypothetical protein
MQPEAPKVMPRLVQPSELPAQLRGFVVGGAGADADAAGTAAPALTAAMAAAGDVLPSGVAGNGDAAPASSRMLAALQDSAGYFAAGRTSSGAAGRTEDLFAGVDASMLAEWGSGASGFNAGRLLSGRGGGGGMSLNEDALFAAQLGDALDEPRRKRRKLNGDAGDATGSAADDDDMRGRKSRHATSDGEPAGASMPRGAAAASSSRGRGPASRGRRARH